MITLNNDLEPSVEEPYVEGQPLELDQLPQEQPLEEEFVRPAIEAEEKYQNDMKAWRAKTSEDTDRYLLEFDAYQPEDDLPVRKQKLIRRVLDVEHDLSPETSTSYEMARAQASNKMFGETLDDEQFFTKLQERAQTTKDARDLDTSMAQSAFLSLTSPEDSNFHDWGAENVDGIISGEENAKNLARWNEHQDRIEEAYGDLLPLIRGTYSAMSNDADWVEYAKSQVSGLDDEEKDKYLYGLRAALGNNPKPEIVNKFKRLGINILKSSRGVKSAVRNARTFVGNEIREDDTTYGFAKLFGSEEDANKVSQNAREDKLLAKQLRENGNFINELRSVFENEYDPVQLLAKEGSRLAAIESGAYQIPGALTTTAIAALPVVGTAITYGSLAESSRQSYMAAILSEGRATGSPISRSEADDIASRMGLVAAVPSMFLERFQATAFTKNKGISKAVSKFDGLIKNSIARRITKFGVASSAETAVELTQEVSDSLVQAAATAFSEEVPDVVWSNGEDGVFDDYFNKFLTTFTAVAPLGVISAHRGVDVELKAQAFKDVSELERRAFGITKHDSESIDNATNPTELVEAYQQAIENKDGNSEEAINATQELAASIEDKAKVEREMVDKGRLLGARTSPDSELLEVYNSKTGEVVAEGLDRASAAGFIMNHFNLKEREKTQLHDEIVSQIEGAQLLQEGSDSVTEFLPFKELTQATAAEEFVGSEERITEEGVDLERLDGGTGDITRSVLGAQLSAGQYGRAANTNVLFGNSTLFTAIHEHAHEVRKRWLRDGSFTFIEQVDALQGIDKAFRELTISRKENGETVTVKGSDRTFLPDDFNDRTPEAQERLVDEAIAQLAEQFSLRSRNGKKTKFRELLNKNLSARVSRGDKGAIKLKAFVRAMRDWFSLNLERSQLMRKAEREGKLDSAQLDELQAKIFGETTQGNHDAKAQEAYDGIVDENVPFSVGGRRASGFAQAQAEGRTFEGKDGLARFELDSSKAKIKSFRFASDEELISQEREEKELQKKFSKKEITGLELEEGWSSLGVKYDGLDKNSAHGITSILDFKELFESYPSLSNYSVIFKDIPLDVIGGGRFKTSAMIDLQGGIISIDNDVLNDVDKLKSTLLHELQHAIQSLEVFELGDNPLNDGYDSYKKSNGEREARGVESRINMTAEERLASPFMNDFASFSVGEIDKNLVAIHNLTEENLNFSRGEFGSIIAPSIAIVRKDISDFDGFGEISLIAPPSRVDPSKDRRNHVWNADSYTARFPRIDYKINNKAEKKVNAELVELSQEVGGNNYSVIPSEFDSMGLESLKEDHVFMYAFLKDTGRNFTPKKEKKAKVSPAMKKLAKKFNRYDLAENSDFISLVEGENAAYAEKKALATYPNPDQKKERDDMISVLKESSPSELRSKADQAAKSLEPSKPDFYENKRALRSKIRSSKKLQSEFNSWVEENYHDLVDKKRIPDGNYSSGQRKYKPFNVATILSLMTKKLAGAEEHSGVGQVRSVHAKKFKSLKQIQGDRDSIISKDEMEVLKEKIDKDFFEITDEIKPYYKYTANSFSFLDIAAEAISSGAHLNSDFEGVPAELTAKISSFIRDLKNAGSEYFEVKVADAVPFRDFSAAVIPKGTSKETKDYLKSQGLRIKTYDSSIANNRRDVIAKEADRSDVSFSVGSVTPAQDAKYLSLAQDPDANKEELDAMVERAARDAGYDSPKVYHGTSKDFNEFSKETIGRVFKFDDEGFFFTNSIEQAKKYASQSKKQTGGSERLISSFLKLDNPFTYKDHAYAFMDHEDPIIGMDDELLISWADRYREDHIEDAKDYGMDGLFYERGNEVLAAVFNPNQIKSAEAITRDESGAIIPLSQRFNEESDDIRFSVGSITPEQDKTSPPEGDEAIAIFNSEVEFPSFPHISLFQSASGEPDDTSLSSDVKTDVSFSVGKAREKHNLILEDLKSLNEAVNKAEQYLSTHGGVIPVTTGSRGGIAFTRYSERNEKLTSVYDENKESYARPIAGDIFEYNGKEATVSDDGVRVVWGDKPWENDPVGWIDNSLIMQKTIVDLRAELANKEADLYLIEEDFDPDKESRLKDKKTVYKRDLSEKASMFAALLDARDVESKNASKSFISKVWGAYAKHDELFQYGKSKSKSAEEIAESISSPGRSISADESSDSVRFISANGSLTIQDADTDRPYIAASGASSSGKKQGGGSQLYMAALDWIHNNGKRIKDDPAGITGINSIRRTSNFFASSIRWGTTKHLKAHAQQEVGRWTRHDTLNTSLLALKEMENTFKAIPEAQDWTFDFKTAKFKNNGRKITDKTFEKTIKKADPSKSGIGLSTLQRAIITSSSIQEFKRGATESIMEAAEAPLRESLTGVSYSVGNSKIADSIITDVTKRIKNPEAKVRIMGSVIERVAAMKREVDVMGVAFGKLSVTKAIVDPRTIKSLKKEAAFRQADLTEEYTNKVHEESGFILEQEDLAKLKEQPLHAYLSKPNDPLHGQLTSKSQAIKQDKLGKKDGDYDGAANVSRTLFGGTLMPDQAAAELYEQGLIAEDDVNLMWEALEQEQASVTNRKEEFKGGKAKLNDAKKRAREEAKAWLDEELAKQERDHNPRTAMLRSLAMYDAILMALPIELRGKMGGYVQLAKLKTDEARLEFMLKKMEKLEKVVDSWVKKEADKDLKKFFKRAAAKRQKSGKTDKGKFDGESHKIFSAIKEATKLTMEEVDAQVAAAESVVAQGSEVDSDTWIRNLMLTNLLPQFGDWKNQTAEGRTEALKAGWHVFERALLDAQIRDAAQRERYEAGREEFKAATGIKHKGEEFNKALQNQKNIDKAKGIKKTAKDLDLNLSGFGSLLERLFGKNELTEQWYEKQRSAEMIQSNLRRRAGDVVNDYFIEKAGSEIKGMNMVADLMKPSIETSSGKYSEMQGLTATMMWMQEDGRKHMEGSKDENGKVTSSWSYDQEFIDHIESNLSDEAKGFRSLLLQKYEEGYAPLNEVHKRVHYIDMPKVSNYSPLTVKSFMEAMDKGIDPFTHAGSGNAGSAGFTKRRSSIAVAEPSFEDAFTVFMAHTDQSAHFIAFAELSKDMNAIIGQRDVMNHVEVKAGEQGRVSLKSWLDFYNEGGARSAGSRLGINRWLHGVFGNMAKMALALKPSVTFIQGTILGGAVVDMPVKSYLKGMAKLASGKLDIRATWNTEFIQQRYLDKPVIMQALQSGDPSQAPNKMQYWVDKIAHYGISGADALFTSATYAIYEDHYTNEANSLELKGEIAAEYIKLKTIKSTEKVSQPTRTGTRSIMENTERSPFKIMGMAFASDSRMKASLLAQTLMSGTKAEKARALVFFYVVNGFGAAVIRNVWRDARNDDDDELFDAENWNLKAMLVATMFGPINGIPIIGDQVSNAANDFFGERNFYGTLADGIGKGAKPLTKLDDYLYGDVDGDRFLKDLEAVLTTAGALSDKAVPAKSIISLLRDLNKLKDNVIAE